MGTSWRASYQRKQSSPNVCGVCWEPFATWQNGEAKTVSCERTHMFCVDCLQKYADEAIFGLGKSRLRCMAPNCDEVYSKSVVKNLLDRKLLKRMRENGVGRCTCKCDDCDWKLKKSSLSERDRERLKLEEKLTNDVIRQCPGCGKSILKDRGCNHVVCSSCHTHMCYVCGVRVAENDYTHECYAEEPGIRCSGFDENWRIMRRERQIAQRTDPTLRTIVSSIHTTDVAPTKLRQVEPEESCRDQKRSVWFAGCTGFGTTFIANTTHEGTSISRNREFTLAEIRLQDAVQMTRIFRFQAPSLKISGSGT